MAAILQDRLNALNDLALTLKHIHWNVVGPNFIAVHTMLDPQVDAVRLMVDDTAERIATLGGSPVGTPGALVASRSWDDYSLGRDDALAHLGALDLVYAGVIESQRKAIETTEELDPVTEDMLIGHSRAAGAVPLVRPRPPGDPEWPAEDHRHPHRGPSGLPHPQEVTRSSRPPRCTSCAGAAYLFGSTWTFVVSTSMCAPWRWSRVASGPVTPAPAG